MKLDAAADSYHSCGTGSAVFPPAILEPVSTSTGLLLTNKSRCEAIAIQAYDGNVELAGANGIRLRWHEPESAWRHYLGYAKARRPNKDFRV